jgi:hypothetical protein
MYTAAFRGLISVSFTTAFRYTLLFACLFVDFSYKAGLLLFRPILPYTMRSESHCALRLWYVAKSAVYHRPRTLNELNTAITAYIRNISQADLQKVFANTIKRVQVCIDARGHHFQHLL